MSVANGGEASTVMNLLCFGCREKTENFFIDERLPAVQVICHKELEVFYFLACFVDSISYTASKIGRSKFPGLKSFNELINSHIFLAILFVRVSVTLISLYCRLRCAFLIWPDSTVPTTRQNCPFDIRSIFCFMLQRNIVSKYFQVPRAVRTVARSDLPGANWNLLFYIHLNFETKSGCIYIKRCVLQKCCVKCRGNA